MRRIILLFYIGIISIISLYIRNCSREIQFDIPPIENAVVINGLVVADSSLILKINRNFNINDFPAVYSESYTVEIESNEGKKEELTLFEDNTFRTSSKFHSGEIVYISTFYKNKLILASDTVPDNAIVNNIKRIDNAGIDEEGIPFSQVFISLSDTNSTKDFYEIKLTLLKPDNQGTIELRPYSTQDPILNNEGLPFFISSAFPFTDKLFSEESATICMNYQTPKIYRNDIIEEMFPNHSLIVEVRKTSYSYYQYRRTLLIQEMSKYPDFWNGMGNPISLYSNIDGGLGILASYSSIIDTLNYEE